MADGGDESVEAPAPSAAGMALLHRLVALSCELPPLTSGAKPFDPASATPVSAEEFLWQLICCKGEATDLVRRTVELQAAVDAHYAGLTWPEAPPAPPDLGLLNQAERAQALSLARVLAARRRAESDLYTGLCAMLGQLWDALARHISLVDRTIGDIQRCLAASGSPLAAPADTPPLGHPTTPA